VFLGRRNGSSKEVSVGKLWVGIDAGKDFHWAAAIDEAGEVVVSRRVENDETDVVALIAETRGGGAEVSWAVDIPGGVAALTLAVLWNRGERVVYLPGISVDRSRDAYRGEAKTDARDARIIAEQARTRKDLTELCPSEDVLAELAVLTSRRRDLVQDQTRAVTRLRAALIGVSPAWSGRWTSRPKALFCWSVGTGPPKRSAEPADVGSRRTFDPKEPREPHNSPTGRFRRRRVRRSACPPKR
jgi:hypothetical protein